MTKKALYKHKKTGDLFAIETDSNGNVLSSSGPLLVKDLNPEELDYDNYWDKDVEAHLGEFVLLSKAECEELLKRTGFFIQESQRSIFDETDCLKKLHKRGKLTEIFTALAVGRVGLAAGNKSGFWEIAMAKEKEERVSRESGLSVVDEEAETKAIEKWLRMVDKPLARKRPYNAGAQIIA